MLANAIKIKEYKFLFLFICIKLMMLFFFLDLNYKYKKFQEVNIYLFQNLKIEPKLETNTFTIKNSNDVSKILSRTFYKIKAFHFTAFEDHFQEPIAKLILKHFFSINETGYTEPQTHRNKFISDPHEIANMITLFSIIICIPSIVFLASNNWKKRFFACVTFQIKNISDYIDGPIIRNFTSPNFSTNSFNYGRFLDGLASGISIAFFLIGSYIYIFRSLKLTMLSLSHQDYNQLNIFYKLWFRVSSYVFKKFRILNINFYSKLPKSDNELKDNNLNIRLLKEVYFKMTIFLIYFVLSGIQWNWSLNKYRDKFSKEFVSQNQSKEINIMTGANFIDLMMLRYTSGLFMVDFYCIFICFNKDWLFIRNGSVILFVLLVVKIIFSFYLFA